MLPHPIPDSLAELIAQRFRVLGEPTRIRILDRLREGEASVQDLTESLGSSRSRTSRSISRRPRAKWHRRKVRRKEGNLALHRIADDSVFELCDRSAAASSASSRS